MPDERAHRGPHPEDARLFAPEAHETLARAADDLAWLLSRGYAAVSALKLVGDRYRLAARQRTAVARATCSDASCAARQVRRIDCAAGAPLSIDGYNVLTTVEAALAGGVILAARDGTYRDMASMHGSYRKVAETRPALELIGQTLAESGVAACRWYLDRPVSNSGRLAQFIGAVGAEHGWAWTVELVPDPDRILAAANEPVATADSAVLDACRAWVNLARTTVERHVPGARIVRLWP